jgi:hypothetical protein
VLRRWLEERDAGLVELDEIADYQVKQAFCYRCELGPADARARRLSAGELAGTPERLAELFMPYIRNAADDMSDRPPAAVGTLSPQGQPRSERPPPERDAANAGRRTSVS